jgi:outer membrane protein assembly factor BamB
LYALDARSGAQLWAAPTGGTVFSSPAVADGVVYVGSDDFSLYAFDAAGETGCSGTPKTCAPLWTAATSGVVRSTPAGGAGVVYVADLAAPLDSRLYAFDAAGQTGCSGQPKTCAPLWTAAAGGLSSPAVAHGTVYIGSGASLYAFDAAGETLCSGNPKTCRPLWAAPTAGGVEGSPAVANGVLYAGAFDGRLYAFDAAGETGCSGSKRRRTCAPLWTSANFGFAVQSSPAIANGNLYVGIGDSLYVFGLP